MCKINDIYFLNNPKCNITSLKNNKYIGRFIIKKISTDIELQSLDDTIWIDKKDFINELNKTISYINIDSEIYAKYILTEDETLLKKLL